MKKIREVSKVQKDIAEAIVDLCNHPGANPALKSMGDMLASAVGIVERKPWVTIVDEKAPVTK